jgi:tyrosyl-tRNA synthetase
MMAKDSAKRLAGEEKNVFTEFTYHSRITILSYHIKNTIACCKWGFRPMGNITTGTELVRRMNVGEEAKAYAMTCPLIKSRRF